MSCPCSDCLNGRFPRNIIEPTLSDTYVMYVHAANASGCVLAASGATLNTDTIDVNQVDSSSYTPGIHDTEHFGDLVVENNDWTAQYCEVCDVVLNSPATYKKHLRGQKHQKQLETFNHQSLTAKSDGKSNSGRTSGSQCMMVQCSTSLVSGHLDTDMVIKKTDVLR